MKCECAIKNNAVPVAAYRFDPPQATQSEEDDGKAIRFQMSLAHTLVSQVNPGGEACGVDFQAGRGFIGRGGLGQANLTRQLAGSPGKRMQPGVRIKTDPTFVPVEPKTEMIFSPWPGRELASQRRRA